VVPPEEPEALAEAILTLYRDPAQVEALGQQGRRHALDTYSFEQALHRYERLFTGLVPTASGVMPLDPDAMPPVAGSPVELPEQAP
jgi:colanic acid biosynthesis glycosyl transferase WcaI